MTLKQNRVLKINRALENKFKINKLCDPYSCYHAFLPDQESDLFDPTTQKK